MTVWLAALSLLAGVPQGLEGGDRIPYRQLAVDDFRAAGPSPGLVSHVRRFGTASCVFIAAGPEMVILVSSESDVREALAEVGKEPTYRARADKLSFRAVLDRGCSWWGPTGSLSRAFRLEHEQIHFAIFEIEARRLGRELLERADEMVADGSSAEEATATLRQLIDEELRQAVEKASARSMAFDDDTSGQLRSEAGRRRTRQQRQLEWLQRIEADLRETSGFQGDTTYRR